MQFTDFLGLIGGLALFLYGMRMMGDGLEHVAGSKLKSLLEKLTKNRVLGVLVGIFITALIQSSSATTVMTVGFVDAGLMSLSQAIGVIMGANVGTTITGQLIALKITDIAPLLAIVGVVMAVFFKHKRVTNIGQVLAGLGILFMGMNAMSVAMEPLREVVWFQELIVSFKNPVLGILAGALITAVIQSSSASIGILQAMAMQGVIGLDSAIFVLFGQNIGTCVTALIATAGAGKNARRTALVHLLFNVAGTVLFTVIVLCFPFVELVESITPGNGVAQIANAHTIFNIVTMLIMLPLANKLALIATKLIPGEDENEGPKLMHIKEVSFGASSIAIAQVEAEVDRMNGLARDNLSMALEAFFKLDESGLGVIHKNEETIDFLNKAITNALVRINAMELPQKDAARLSGVYHIVGDIERIGDHAENIAGYVTSSKERGLNFSDEAIGELKELSTKIFTMMDSSYAFYKNPTRGMSYDEIYDLEESIDDDTDELERGHIERLNAGKCTPDAGMLYVEILTDLERAADHALNIAQAALKGGKPLSREWQDDLK